MVKKHFFLIFAATLLSLLAAPPAFSQGLGGGPGGGTGGICLGGGLGGGLGGACCGDGVCEPGELCAADCSINSVCGDGVCNQDESCSSCYSDCGECTYCGDGICNGLESCATCSDCTGCFPTPVQAFYRGKTDETIRTAFSFTGAGWFGDEPLGNGAKSSRSPAAVKFNNRVFLFYRGASNSEIYVTWSDDGQTWSGNRQLGNGAKTNEGVAAVVFNNRIYVFNRGVSSRAIWMSSSSDGFNWSSADNRKIVAKEDGTTGAPSAVVFDGKIEVHWRHDKYSVKSTSSPDGVNWTAGANYAVTTKDGVGLAVFKGKLYRATSQYRWIETSPGIRTTYANRIGVHRRAPGEDWETIIWVLSAETNKRPALAPSEDRLYMLYKGVHEDDLFFSFTDDGEDWAGNQAAVGETEKGGPALVFTD